MATFLKHRGLPSTALQRQPEASDVSVSTSYGEWQPETTNTTGTTNSTRKHNYQQDCCDVVVGVEELLAHDDHKHRDYDSQHQLPVYDCDDSGGGQPCLPKQNRRHWWQQWWKRLERQGHRNYHPTLRTLRGGGGGGGGGWPNNNDKRDSDHTRARVGILPAQLQLLFLILLLGAGVFVSTRAVRRVYRIVTGTISDADAEVQARWRQWTVLETRRHHRAASPHQDHNNHSNNSNNNNNVAIVMLADSSAKFAAFKQQSIDDKRRYAERHGYAFVLCDTLLDADRSPMWSKLRFIWNALQRYDLVVWLDVDTIIWNKTIPVEYYTGPAFYESRSSAGSTGSRGDDGDDDTHVGILPYQSHNDIYAQIDIHRSMESRYFNAGIMIWRRSAYSRRVLAQAYRQWQIQVLAGIWYFDADQDALNMVINRTTTTTTTMHDNMEDHVKLYRYGQLWQLGIHPVLKNTFIVHFPNCHSCSEVYLALYDDATRQSDK